MEIKLNKNESNLCNKNSNFMKIFIYDISIQLNLTISNYRIIPIKLYYN